MKRKMFCMLVLLLMANGCATKGDIDITRNDIDAVKTRMFSLERDLGGIRSESKEGIGTIEKNFKTDVTAVRKLSADIQASIDSTKTELQAMNGKIDDMTQLVKKPAEDLARYRIDADKRIINLEEKILKLQSAYDDLIKKLSETSVPKEVAPTADVLYTKGLEVFKAGDMPTARESFTKFLEQFPQHELAANAHYWIGETHYSEKNYEPAILAFQDVIKNYPQKEKVPAAMLKQAMAFRGINDVKSSKYVLKKLVEGFPKSEEAKKAREMLKQ